MADEIVAFIEARLAEDERIARAATAAPWLIDEGDEVPAHSLTIKGGPDQIPTVPGHETVVYSEYIWDETRPDFAHIARWDPARVLREVAAKRGILTRYQNAMRGLDTLENSDPQPPGPVISGRDLLRTNVAALRIAVRLLAAAYADHPDYREEWLAGS